MKPPIARKQPTVLEKHNHQRTDNYFWMKDRNSPEVIEYLKAENAYCEDMQAHNEGLRETIFQEMKGRLKEDDSTAPYFSNGYWYYTRYEEGKELAIYCRIKEENGEEEILIDENLEAENHDYYEIVSMTVSPDNNQLIFAEDLTGRRQYTIKIKNLTSGNIQKLPIENTSSSIVWHNNNEDFYYVQKEAETLRPFQLKVFNVKRQSEKILFTEVDAKYSCGVSKSKDDQLILFGCYSTLTTEFHYKSANDSSEFTCFLKREEKHEYYLDIVDGTWFIKSNFNAPNFIVASTPLGKHEQENWTILQDHDESVYVEDFEVFRNHLCILDKTNGLGRISIVDLKTKERVLVPVEEETYSVYFGINEEVDLPYIRIGYTSMTKPSSVYRIDLTSLNWTLIKEQEVLGNFTSTDYHAERLWIEARDGVKVPVSLVYKKDLFERDGSAPLLVYAYGSYGNAIEPYFSSARLSLLDRGFVYAIAHIRGGDDLGQHWYEDGKLLKKKNTFTDFIDVSKALIDMNYAAPEKVFAMGGSAGGLLMGAVANMAPELWAGIVSQVPFVDVITTMLDDSIPLTTGEYDEWGNPNDKVYYDYMLSYSPYDQIEQKAYPPMLVISGLHDSQVQYWEPTKYVAKLRELKSDNNPVLLKTNMDAGHGGAAGRYEALKEVAFNYAFLIDLAGK